MATTTYVIAKTISGISIDKAIPSMNFRFAFLSSALANKIINETLTDAGGMAHTIATMQAQKQGSNVGTMPI